MSDRTQTTRGIPSLMEFRCTCAGPSVNVNVDGNAGHSPGCGANPNNWPEALKVCGGCGIPFSEPVTPRYALSIFGDLESAEFACEGCGGDY